MTEAATARHQAFPSRFLVVDDDAAFRNRLVRALAARGMVAHGAGSAAEAMEVARRVSPEAGILDMRMPGGSGLELVADLSAMLPGMQLVVLTGYGNIATAVEAVRRGAIDYLTKPLDTEQILCAFGRGAKPATAPSIDSTPSLARVEWEHIQRILMDCDGNISLAARKLRVHRRSLQRKLGKLPPAD